MASNYRHIGKATPRKDARAIVTGRAQYIDDVKLPGMLYGKVLRSPYPHARIKNIDTSKAEACPGVKAVLTYKNVPGWMGGVPYHRPVLDSTVRFVGDAVALVAAETGESAEEALFEALEARAAAGEDIEAWAEDSFFDFDDASDVSADDLITGLAAEDWFDKLVLAWEADEDLDTIIGALNDYERATFNELLQEYGEEGMTI